MRDLTDAEVKLLGEDGCLFCGSKAFREGPSGGLSINVYCRRCGAGYNIMMGMGKAQLIKEPELDT